MEEKLKELVHHYYWDLDLNCAKTTLASLGDAFEVTIGEQTLQAASGLPGAGGHKEQCGIVEGTLMFLGIYFSQKGKDKKEIAAVCHQFVEKFLEKFASIHCRDLKPAAVQGKESPHACEELTKNAVIFAADFIKSIR